MKKPGADDFQLLSIPNSTSCLSHFASNVLIYMQLSEMNLELYNLLDRLTGT